MQLTAACPYSRVIMHTVADCNVNVCVGYVTLDTHTGLNACWDAWIFVTFSSMRSVLGWACEVTRLLHLPFIDLPRRFVQ